MKKQHVLYLMTSFNIGGAEIDVLNLSKALLKKHYKVTIASRGGDLEQQLPTGVRTLRLSMRSGSLLSLCWDMINVLVYSLIFRVSVINPQSIQGVLASALTAKLLGIPLLATIHNIHHSRNTRKGAFFLNHLTDVNLFVSDYERRKFIDAGLREELTRVIYSGINLERFQDNPRRIGPFRTIGLVGRLSEEKGIDYAIRAFALLKDRFPDVRMLIVGDGPEREKLEALAEMLAGDRIEFTGARNDVPQLMSQIDFLVLPSLTESLSVVAREAMAAGKPVISSAVGGMSELIQDNINGKLVPAGDVERLKEAMESWLTSPSTVQQMGALVKQQIRKQFSLTRWVAEMDQLYQKASGIRVSNYQTRSHLLYVTTRFPFPVFKGDKLRAYNQIKELSKRHHIHLLCLMEDESDYQHFHQLEPFCQSITPVRFSKRMAAILRCLAHFSWIPSQIGYFHSRELKALLPKVVLSKNIDTVYCQLIRAGQYAKAISNVWKVIDFVDAFSLNLRRNIRMEPLYRKPVYFVRMLKTFFYEQKMLKCFDKALIISEKDKQALGDERLLVVPNGVDQRELPSNETEPKEKLLVFSGNMDYWPNEDAARRLVEEILPLVDEDVKVHLVGINNNPKVQKYQGLSNERVMVTGMVPSIPDYIQQATVAVCPMFLGAGQQNKVLEAMSAGVPVVVTDIANAGVNATDCVRIANTSAEMAQQINHLMRDAHLRQQLREKALQFIRSKYDWNQITLFMEKDLWKKNTASIPTRTLADSRLFWLLNFQEQLS